MTGTSSPLDISTRLHRIAELARKGPAVLTTLAHHIDVEFLREAYRRTRKDGAVGVDGQTAAVYAEKLEENLRDLLDRFKSGTYKAPPVRRVTGTGLSRAEQHRRPVIVAVPPANGKSTPLPWILTTLATPRSSMMSPPATIVHVFDGSKA